jgi:hypothetical protein
MGAVSMRAGTAEGISMTDPTFAIAAAPIVDALRPIMSAVVTAIIGVAVMFGVALPPRRTGVILQPSYVDLLRHAAQTEAGVLVAEAVRSLSSRSILASSLAIADARPKGTNITSEARASRRMA